MKYAAPCIFIHVCGQACQSILEVFLALAGGWPGRIKRNRAMYDSQHSREARWIFRAGDVTYF
jgi:hypothetical protein